MKKGEEKEARLKGIWQRCQKNATKTLETNSGVEKCQSVVKAAERPALAVKAMSLKC